MTRTSDKALSIQTAGLQALYWMVFCPVYSFSSVFLLSRDFSNQQIGWVIAIGNILAVILQPLMGTILDRVKRISIKWVLILLALLDLGLLVGLMWLPLGLLWLAVFYVGVVSLLITMQPLVTSLTFEYINAGRNINFGITRAAGSVGFAILSTILGYWIIQTTPGIIPVLSAILVLAYILLLVTFPKVERQDHPVVDELSAVITSRGFLRRYDRFVPFLIGVACLFTFHTTINTFLAQIMTSVGGKTTDLGISLTIAAICELPAFLGFSWLAARFSSSTLLKFSGIMYALRSLIFLVASSVFLVNLGQVFQAFSFAVFIPASVYFINKTMKEEDKVKGQTYVTGLATLGGVIGSIVGGRLLDTASVHAMLIFAAVAAVAGGLLMVYSVRQKLPAGK
jgi:PPP family 3-phenylpropionic acid transporter